MTVVSCFLCIASPAAAQTHWDIGAEAGAMRRVLSQRPAQPNEGPPGHDAGFGPVGELHLHLAVLPMLRVGAYITHDVSPISGQPARQTTSGGLRVKLTPPFPSGRWRAWAFAGFGYAGVYGPSYHTTLLLSQSQGGTPSATDALVDGAGGGYFEVPVGVGIGYLVKKPWQVTLELGTRFGFGFNGSLYDTTNGRGATAPGYSPVGVDVPGEDTFALYLSAGLSLDL